MSLALLSELKRRRVFRALVGYGIGAFAVLQIVEPIMHGLHWPDALLSYVVVALAAGFPIVVTLAWIFDVNQGRVERTADAAGPKGARLALVLAGIGALAAAPGLIWYLVVRRAPAPPRAPSIVVLPFANLSGDMENEYFSDGVTEEIINALAAVEGVNVVARTSAFSFKGKGLDVRRIGEELNVATVLEGSVRRDGNQLRIAAQLVGAADGYHLWSKTYDRELKNVFSLEDEIARAIVQALKPKLVPAAALAPESTSNTDAHDLYLRGHHLANLRTKESLAKAAALYEQAIALDPKYALAHSGAADCYVFSIYYRGVPVTDALAKAKAHALRAVELDGALAEGHASLAIVSEINYDWGAAQREFKRAIELRPGYSTAHHWYGLYLIYVGKLAQSRVELEQARQLDPTSAIINNALTLWFMMNHEYDRAIEQSLRAVELSPDFVIARFSLAQSYQLAGRFDEALATLDKMTGRSNFARVSRAGVLGAAGRRAEAQRLVEEAEDRLAADWVPPGMLALAHVAIGNIDRAFLWLRRSLQERDQVTQSLKLHPGWDPIRSDPRFRALLEQMKLD